MGTQSPFGMMAGRGAQGAALLLLCLALSACVSRPAGTDLFGRPIATVPRPDSDPTPRTVSTADGESGLAGVGLTPPAPTSGWTPAPVSANAREVPASSYVVQRGDTLRGIGNRSGAGSEAIATANGLAPPYMLQVGQRLTIPPGRYHEVLTGQTGIAIARAYGVSWAALIAENALVEPYVLRVGQRLRLPASGAPDREMTLEERAQAFRLDIDGIMAGSDPAGIAVTPAPRPASAPPAPAGTSRFAWPLTGTLLQRFGPAGNGRVNDGINIAAAAGTPVRATAAGTVTYAGNEIALFGGLVLIDHGGGWTSAYGHLTDVQVSVGQSVRAGQVIASAGATGQVQQPQLHFELRQNRRPVNPLSHLPPR